MMMIMMMVPIDSDETRFDVNRIIQIMINIGIGPQMIMMMMIMMILMMIMMIVVVVMIIMTMMIMMIPRNHKNIMKKMTENGHCVD